VKKKVLFILDTISIGGAEFSILELVRCLPTFEAVVCVVYKAENQFRSEFEKLPIKLIFLDINSRFGFVEGGIKLIGVLKQERPDIVHATHFKSEFISRIVVPSFDIPLVGSLISDTYGRERYSLVTSRERLKLEIYRFLDKVTAFRSDLYISVSEAIVEPNRKYLGIPLQKITVIPNGRDVDKYDSAVAVSRSVIGEKIKENDVLMVSNSRVVQSKGFDEMFKAFKMLCGEFDHLYFIVVGGGENIEFYRQMSKQLDIDDKVVFLGNRKDMPQLLKACDIFWFASHYEGSPGVIIEGMLSKLPIIASDIAPVTENLIDGYNGLLFPRGEAEELARKTALLLQDRIKKEEMVCRSYELGKTKFNIKALAKIHEQTYLDLIESKR